MALKRWCMWLKRYPCSKIHDNYAVATCTLPTWEDGAEGADGADADIPPMRSGHCGGEACKHVQTQFLFWLQ